MRTSDSDDPRWGWRSPLPEFYGAEPRVVRLSLERFVRDADPSQLRAWSNDIPWLQEECRSLVRCDDEAKTYTAILEYELPRESRRPDVILLENGTVLVMELKGKATPTRADLDQVSAYARDLRCYHAECADRPVVPVLVPTRADALETTIDDVRVAGPRGLHQLLLRIANELSGPPITPEAFLDPDAYQPLPTLVRAARDLFAREPLPTIKRARAATDPAVDRITEIAHEAAATGSRRLVLLTGIPGSGKTLVGLRLVHAGFLDDLAVDRGTGKPSAPAVFLSGNRPLVKVLQDALSDAGGGGKVFIRDVKDYVKQYSRARSSVPPEHMLIFDEAQRAWDADHVARKHPDQDPRSEPEHFVEFAERIPEWCVVVGLIGTGQEIHAGEHGGIVQWRRAVEGSRDPDAWTIHAPAELEEVFLDGDLQTEWEPSLNLDTELRFHAARSLHEWVETFITEGPTERAARLGDRLWEEGYRLLVTRDLETATAYAHDRFDEDPDARYGLLASSKAKDLPAHGVDNSYVATRKVKIGPWYNAPKNDPDSCCNLTDVATEFSSQGLELDLAVLAWGSDFLRIEDEWTARHSGRTLHVEDTLGLRRNVYRVLLTRGREGTVVFLPGDSRYDETCRALLEAGARRLEDPLDW
ncbi:MAG: DNA/RNA helicase domain-containing protein [Gemmatimonadota bacterium]|nr:DNA/RNA helicase domain-containing protein [Gemmatimonadota bacterium]